MIRLMEADLDRHEVAINEHLRSSFTIRGFALTVVAALIASSFASGLSLPAFFAIGAGVLFVGVDYYYSRLYSHTKQRLPVLVSLSTTYRRLLARPSRTRDELDDFRGDLRSYSSGAVVSEESPKLVRTLRWKRVSLPAPLSVGPLKVFLPLYLALIAAAAVSGVYVKQQSSVATPLQLELLCVSQAPALSSLPDPLGQLGTPCVPVLP